MPKPTPGTRFLAHAVTDHAQELTNAIVAALEQGVRPWQRPWDSEKCGGSHAPVNATTGIGYRGINALVLGMHPKAFETQDPRWATFKQALDEGWHVRKGEKGTYIYKYKPIEIEDERAEDGTRTIPMLKVYTVFHASQIEGIPARVKPTGAEAPWTKPEAVEIILHNSRAVIRYGGDRAYYSPGTDHIQLPPHGAFTGPESYGAVALHEAFHWTGHEKRLGRDLRGRFGSEAYAQEELRAELASVFLGGELGLPTDIPHHASYMQSWLKALKGDKREIFRAAADAQRGADYLGAFHPDLAARMKADRTAQQGEEARAVVGARPDTKQPQPAAPQ